MSGVGCATFLFSSLLHILHAALAQTPKICHGDLEDCGPNEACSQQKQSADSHFGVCVCVRGFHREGDLCVLNLPPTSSPSTSEPIMSGFASAVLWTLVVLAVTVAGLAFIIRRFALLDRLYALRVRRYDTVFVSTAANVDDDSPIT